MIFHFFLYKKKKNVKSKWREKMKQKNDHTEHRNEKNRMTTNVRITLCMMFVKKKRIHFINEN